MVQEPPEERLLLTPVPSPVVGVDLVGVVVVLLVLPYPTSSAEVVTACVVALAIGEEVEAVVCWVGIVSIAVDSAAVDGAAVDGAAVDGVVIAGGSERTISYQSCNPPYQYS